jgi:transposase
MRETITMSRKQLKQAHVLRKYNEGLLSRKEASTAIGLSERQITRLSKGMKEEGETALIHKNTGRKPVHALTDETKTRILEIHSDTMHSKCNHLHFQELLERNHEIKVSYSALYNLMKENGIHSPKKKRKAIKHRRRKRKPMAGELLQIDATPFDWFDTGTLLAIHGSIDDATGMLTGLYMTENECLQGYFEVMRHTVLNFGVPLAVYSDKHTIFRSPLTDKKADAGEEANLTQFGRALDELGVEIIYANSAQAKGRIERAWATLQSRLPVEFKIRGITTIESANEFLANEYISLFNAKFKVEAEDGSIFVAYNHRESLDDILCIKENRKTDNAGSFSYMGKKFKVLDEGFPLIPAKATIEVLVTTRNSIRVRYKDQTFNTVLSTKEEAPKAKPKKRTAATKAKKPHLCHSTDEWKKVWHQESYEDSMAFLYELFFKKAA